MPSRRSYLRSLGAIGGLCVGGTVSGEHVAADQQSTSDCQSYFKTGFEEGLDEQFTRQEGQVTTTTEHAAADERALFMAADTDQWNSELFTTATFCGPTIARTKVRYVDNGGGGTNFLFGFADPDPSSYASVLVSTNYNDAVNVREWDEGGQVSSLGHLPVIVDTDWRLLELTATAAGLTVNVEGTTRQFETNLDWAGREKALEFRVKTVITDGDDVSAAFDSAKVLSR